MDEIVVRGVCSNSGFGVATQGLIRVIQQAGYPVKFMHINAFAPQHRIGFSKENLYWLDSISVEEFKYDLSDKILIDVGSLIYAYTSSKIPAKKRILYCTYETIKINRDYVEMMNNRYDEIWTASNFNKMSFMSSGVKKPIKIIPHYIDESLYSSPKPLKIKNKRNFNFIYNCDLTYRKGLHYLIPAFIECFDYDEDVSMTLKISMSISNSKEIIIDSLNRLLFLKELHNKKHPPILLLTDNLESKLIPSVYASGDCYSAPFMSEGFGLPIAEAMFCGLPIVATRAAAPIDFLSDKDTLFIELDDKNPTIPINDEWQLKIDPRYQGQQIYNPSYTNLKDNMRYAFDNQVVMKEMGKKAKENISKLLNIQTLSETFKKIYE